MDWLGYILCIFIGAFLAIAIQWLFFIWYVHTAPTGNSDLDPPPQFHLPKNLENMGMYSDNGDCAAAVSLTLQFLFQELKHAPVPLAWLHRKLHQEVIDLLTRTTSGKLFESLTVRNVLTGDAAPRVRWAGVENVETGTGGYLKTVDLIVDIHYSGGFKLTVDAGMLLGKTACFHIEVAHLSGRARVRFTREPYTHWSLSFLSPPHLDLFVHPLQKRIAALLQAHARRALQKRHTLPNYTIKYKPFFTKIDPAQLDLPVDDSTIKFQGNFEINIMEISRLFSKSWASAKSDSSQVYFTLSLDSNPWISFRQNEEYNIFTIDIVVNKERNQQLGTVFKQIQSSDKAKFFVVIETVVPLSAAYKADLRRDDIIIAVDSKIVNGMNHIVKIIKSINRPCFTIRIERRTKKNNSAESEKSFRKDDMQKLDTLSAENISDDSGSVKRGKSNSFSFRKMSEVLETAKNVGQEGKAFLRGNSVNNTAQDQETSNIHETNKNSGDETSKATNLTSVNTVSFSKHTDSLAFGFGLRKRRCSVENKTSSDSSTGSTPSASSPGTPSKRTDKTNREQSKLNPEDLQKDINQSHSFDSSMNIDAQKLDDKQFDGVKKNYSDVSLSAPRICVMNAADNSKNKIDQYEIIDLLQTYTSKILPLSDIIQFNENMSFKLNRNHRYLNLNIWGKNSINEDTLLAYLNIPLQTALKECSNSKMSQYIKKYILLPPEVNLSVSKIHPLSSHSGFEPCLCYGDVLITFSWPNQINMTDLKVPENKYNSQDSENDCLSEYELLETHILDEDSIKSKSVDDCMTWKSHDFIRTHFHRSTQCDFCRKKIWLKDAVQCRDCAMCCHKKCVSKCLSSVRCPLPIGQDDSTSPQREYYDDNTSQMPEFSMTEYLDTSDEAAHSNQDSSQKHLSTKADEGLLGRSAFSGLLGGLRRVGSAHSLCPQGPTTPIARSLPPSPHHTSRSQSPDEDTAWQALEVAAGEGVKSANDLLKPLLAANLSADTLLSKARDFGPRLLAHLPPEERVDRLSNLICEVRMTLDNENTKLMELQQLLGSKNLTSQEKSKYNRSLEECEEKSQALTALLLHCCSAMQSANKNSV